jgi:hypothetical protein
VDNVKIDLGEMGFYSGCDLFCGYFSLLDDMNRAIHEPGMTITVCLLMLFNDSVIVETV